ncbi:SecDF P1 head subdomain-containing protein [Sandaracinus amylolyticus]|uniref:SecDF P1 head subdomain domain-containing protein n=1 Tax=Sandaracinus amylolyticus TaxID=927083 RepID=A0A0F6VYK1_9BACT|nr:hypothetical protein [Sandaracinus amylolyticus]AKF02906.1 hypothetical protein DB32_000054 [Sandaracinus amylolyticus]
MQTARASIVTFALLASCAFGVEQYRERPPAPSLAIRMVAVEGAEGEVLPRWSGETDELLAVEHGVVVESRNIRHVRLLEAADGSRILVLDLDDTGRSRLHEASTLHVGRRLAIVVDGRIVAAPIIRTPLTEGEAYVAVPEPDLERAFEVLSTRN